MVILLTYIADAAVGQGQQGFLPMTASERGMVFGLSSIVLFFISFGISYKEKSKTTTFLLIAGGVIMGTSVLASSAISDEGIMEISSSFMSVIIIGYVIMGLGIFRIIQRK